MFLVTVRRPEWWINMSQESIVEGREEEKTMEMHQNGRGISSEQEQQKIVWPVKNTVYPFTLVLS